MIRSLSDGSARSGCMNALPAADALRESPTTAEPAGPPLNADGDEIQALGARLDAILRFHSQLLRAYAEKGQR